MTRNSRWALLAAVTASAVLTTGAGPQTSVEQELPEGVTAAMVEEGGALFAGDGICMTCHGEAGAGTPVGPTLADGEWLNIDGSYEAIVELVMTGVAQPKQHPVPMLPRGGTEITDDQVKAVAAYVWTLAQG